MKRIIFVVALGLVWGCTDEKGIETDFNHITASNRKLTEVIIKDVFTPPVASRIYAYCNLAAYESLVPFNDSLVSMNGQVQGLSIEPIDNQGVNPQIASFVAFHTVAHALVFNAEAIELYQTKLLDSLKQHVSNRVYKKSLAYGVAISEVILEWANKDGYHERTGLARHNPGKNRMEWEPTPPDFMGGIEPHWSTIRTFVIDSSTQFPPIKPTAFDSAKTSLFYKEAMDVYKMVKETNDKSLATAKYWDCNPNISYNKGHLKVYEQKISPGGHWISIACIVADSKKLDIYQTAETTMVTAIAIADAFISCWDEKYRSLVIRPETYINRYIDSEWRPILQTPAFPEYTSGHSVISAAASVALTHLHGPDVSFRDDTEVPFGLEARDYNSFLEASSEAAISRFYGGIHYMPAIDNGVTQGQAVGNFVIKKIRTKRNK